MSNISNLYNINDVQDLSNDTAATIAGGATAIPTRPGEAIDIILYSEPNFKGDRLNISTGGDLAALGWANRVSSIKVPKTTQRAWIFTTDANGVGSLLIVRPGRSVARLARLSDNTTPFDNNIKYTKSVVSP